MCSSFLSKVSSLSKSQRFFSKLKKKDFEQEKKSAILLSLEWDTFLHHTIREKRRMLHAILNL